MKRLFLAGAALGVLIASPAFAQQKTIKLGVLTDMSGPYADVGGTGNVVAEVGQSVATAQQQAICRVAKQIVDMMEKPW